MPCTTLSIMTVLPLMVRGVSRTKSCTRLTTSGAACSAVADAVAKQRRDVVTKGEKMKADFERISQL